jgi:hypothetical protein
LKKGWPPTGPNFLCALKSSGGGEPNIILTIFYCSLMVMTSLI